MNATEKPRRIIVGVARTVIREAHLPVVTMRSTERQWLM